jgi:hypothetical protein
MQNRLAKPSNSLAPGNALILRASDKDARRISISTSTLATYSAAAKSLVGAQHWFTLSLEGCAPFPQDFNHAAPLPWIPHV